MPDLDALRAEIRASWLADEATALRAMLAADPGAQSPQGEDAEARIAARTVDLVRHLREGANAGLMESFLAQYGLSTQEGVALMCLAEALLRVPDAATVDALIQDKLAPGDWGRHLGQSSSPLVNASTWALMLTGRVIRPDETADWDVPRLLHRVVRRAGEPLVRTAVGQAIRVLGAQFVLGRDISEALRNAATHEARGFTYSYDMLGEAARTETDAQKYFLSYARAIAAIAEHCPHADLRQNSGISVKLSALHPRYEYAQKAAVMEELVPRVAALALHARNANMGFNIDAEEQDRLDLSLDVIEAVLSAPALRGWGGFAAVVQAYGKRAPAVLDWLHALARRLDRKIMVRLVKGAYWDGEIKAAQVAGLAGYPVWTRKAATDQAYLHCARKLFGMTDRLYPQFATHNAHTVAAILELAGNTGNFEFQRLHGMGEALHARVRASTGHRCRIYAPVGVHKDLLAYLVRRLLENGANSSFVHQVLDADVPPQSLARPPRERLAAVATLPNPRVPLPEKMFGAARRNSAGVSLADPPSVAALQAAMAPFRAHLWHAGSGRAVLNPAEPSDTVGTVAEATHVTIDAAIAAASASTWGTVPLADRAACLDRAADAFQASLPEFLALLAREAGKTLPDGVAEVREAIDFLRYYAAEARAHLTGTAPRGPFACISPWNFPLAIFTGQVAAALVAGNPALAKPAPQTPLVAARAAALLHEAGVPADALHLLPGGAEVGAALTQDARIAGVVFTGSTGAARKIEAAMAGHLDPDAPLIAETGGINAMIADSTSLPEQVVRDAIASAFQSAGQRCSAARLLCLQEDIAEHTLEMLKGAMDTLRLGDPWHLSTDIGPVIDTAARDRIAAHVEAHAGQVLKRLAAPARGSFIGPTLIRLDRVGDLAAEVFGPVLHVVTFAAGGHASLVDAISAQGFGLTMGLHTRVDARVAEVVARARVGNLYVNRNQIGAVVGVQPFGGEGLSGTGPKAGGPHYLARFVRGAGMALPPDAIVLPGPAGESNRLTHHPRGRVLLLGASPALEARITATGNTLVRDAALTDPAIDAVAHAGPVAERRAIRKTLAAREGRIIPLLTEADPPSRFLLERTVSIDTTASGGNVALLSAGED
jgi:RHH-type proline utilization regulon transcriptional repressor/proline dehydrogenase/delta 1-pyrroline-5-carboxylate dehydrogenase